MEIENQQHRIILEEIARRVMLERGLLPEFSPEVLAQLETIQSPALPNGNPIRDLRHLLWASIDNDDSRDLDQLTVAEPLPADRIKVLVAVADVDALVENVTAIDKHARHNTSSVYTAAKTFPMLPEKLSTNLTSLNYHEDRLAIVIEMAIDKDGALHESTIYQAHVHNHAQLAYNSVTAWLEGKSPAPDALAAVPGLAENLRLQEEAAERIKEFRRIHGALTFETHEVRPVFDGDTLERLEVEKKNRAKELVENFMIAANGVTARFLAAQKYPSIRRVVRSPQRWDRIVTIAAERGYLLPGAPDSRALEAFLLREKAEDPLRFPDLSLTIIKLLGAGEYVAEHPESTAPGHFGLAVRDYTHSTAPNRRYTDLITQRLLKAALKKEPIPYTYEELDQLAHHCTEEEDEVHKVERQVSKSAVALLLSSRLGEKFSALVTGAAAKGTWVRLLAVPVEGKLIDGFEGVDVGDRIRVQLLRVDIEQGYIDFKRIHAN